MRDLWTVGIIYCAMLTACERFIDYRRADQWCRAANTFVQTYRESSMSGSCRACYGGLLTATGRWSEAEEQLRLALQAFEVSQHRNMRIDAITRLACLRIQQGRFDDAQRLLEGHEHHPEAVLPMALLHLGRGDVATARAQLERRLDQLGSGSLQTLPLLSLLVEVQIQSADLDAARVTVEQLQQLRTRSGLPYAAGIAELATARVCAALGNDPRGPFETAIAALLEAEMPLELGEARLGLAEAVVDAAPQLAQREARAALAIFSELGSRPRMDAASAVLRRLSGSGKTGPKSYGSLSQRELEVLRLLGLGYSNDQLASQLVISRRTAEHHVSNILAKLGISSRAEAAAYAARRHIGGE